MNVLRDAYSQNVLEVHVQLKMSLSQLLLFHNNDKINLYIKLEEWWRNLEAPKAAR